DDEADGSVELVDAEGARPPGAGGGRGRAESGAQAGRPDGVWPGLSLRSPGVVSGASKTQPRPQERGEEAGMGANGPSFFEGLSEGEVAAAVGRLPVLRFPAGATIIARGDTLADVYVIRSGTSDVFFPNRDGVEECINHAGPGDTLGEMSFFTR